MDHNSYSNDITKIGGSSTPEGNYVITVTNPGCTTTVGGVTYYSCYLLTATPAPGSAQAARDTACATITLNDKGQKGSTGGGSCW